MKNILSLVLICCFLFACEKEKVTEIKSINFRETEVVIEVGKTISIQPIIDPIGLESTLIWWSTDINVATVSNSGQVSAIKEGSSVISVRSNNGALAYYKLTVTKETPLTNIAFSREAIEVPLGDTTIKLVVLFTPETATNKNITWNVEDSKIATISKEGFIKPLKEGSTIVSIQSEDGGFKANCKIDVLQGVQLVGLTFTQTELTKSLSVEPFFLEITRYPSNGVLVNPVWTSSKPTIAKVSPDGLISLFGEGETEITLTSGSVSASCIIKTIDTERMGINPIPVQIYNFTGVNKPLINEGGFTRIASFDGKYVALFSRHPSVGDKRVVLYDYRELGNSPAPILLKNDILDGGLFKIVSGRMKGDKTYACNLGTTAEHPLKIYYWADANPNTEAEVLVDVKLDNWIERFGDNMSIDIDDNGNGYIFIPQHFWAGTSRILRWKVTNFNKVDRQKPEEIYLANSDLYGGNWPTFNRINEENTYVLNGYYKVPAVMTLDGKLKVTNEDVSNRFREMHDVFVVNFNRGRYLIGIRILQEIAQFVMYDISGGASTEEALTIFYQMNSLESVPVPIYSFDFGSQNPNGGQPIGSVGWAIIDGKLVIMTAAANKGFAVIEFAKKGS